jgi:hypothetical protein
MTNDEKVWECGSLMVFEVFTEATEKKERLM